MATPTCIHRTVFSTVNMIEPSDIADVAVSLPAQTSAGDDQDLDLDPRDYILHLSWRPGIPHIAASGSNNLIKVYSNEKLKELAVLSGHIAPITGLEFSTTSGNILRSCDEAGVLNEWDLRVSNTSPVTKRTALSMESASNPLYSLSTSCDDITVACASEAMIFLWDLRGSSSNTILEENHADTVHMARFHPSVPSLLATGCVDGLVCVCNTSLPESHSDHVISVLNVESSITDMDFFDEMGMWITTGNESLSLWNWDDAKCMVDYGVNTRGVLAQSLAASSASSTLVDYLMKCGYDAGMNSLVAFAGNNDGDIMFFRVNVGEGTAGQTPTPIALLKADSNAHRDIIRDIVWDFGSGTGVSGGEDALLCLWSSYAAGGGVLRSGKSSKSKGKMKDGKGKARTMPY